LIEAGLKHAKSLQEAIAVGDAKVEEARKQFAEAEGQLWAELEEETTLLNLEQEKTTGLSAWKTTIGQIIRDTDAKALSTCSFYCLQAFPSYRFMLIPDSYVSAGLFPDSQERASLTISKMRTDNSVADVSAPWGIEDHLAALHSRISHMRVVDRHLGELPVAALKIFKFLWVEGAGKRLAEWRHSAARAGADTVLRFANSWYEDLDLDALHSMRADAPTDKVPEKTAVRRNRAYRIACYALTNTFIPPPVDLAEEFADAEEEEEEEEEETEDSEAEEDAAPDAPGEQAPEDPRAPEQAPESSSPLYED
jgi:hypothetical protein